MGLFSVDGHDAVANGVRGRVKTDGQAYQWSFRRKPYQLVDETRRRHRDTTRRDRERVFIGQDFERCQHAVQVQKRLTHSHEHDVAAGWWLRKLTAREHELREDLPGLEIALEPDRS